MQLCLDMKNISVIKVKTVPATFYLKGSYYAYYTFSLSYKVGMGSLDD